MGRFSLGRKLSIICEAQREPDTIVAARWNIHPQTITVWRRKYKDQIDPYKRALLETEIERKRALRFENELRHAREEIERLRAELEREKRSRIL